MGDAIPGRSRALRAARRGGYFVWMGYVPSARWLRRAVAGSAMLVTAASLPARAGMVALQAVSTMVSQPGDIGHICVMIASNGQKVAGVESKLSWDGTCATMTDPPHCYNAPPGKQVIPDLAHQADFTTKVLVLAMDNVDPIPDGPLYCCDFEGEADPGQCCPINITGAGASDPAANKITAIGNSAQICTASAGQPAAGLTGGNNQPLSGGNAPVGNETGPGPAAPAPAPAAPAGAPVNQVLQGGGARVEVPTLQAVPPTPAPPTTPVATAAAGAAPAAGSAPRPPLPPATAAVAPTAQVPPTAAAPPTAATEAPTSPPTEPPAAAPVATRAAAPPPTRGVPPARQQQAEPMAKAGNGSGWFGCQVGPSSAGPVVGLGLIALFGAMLQRRRRARRPPEFRTQR